MAMLKCEHYVGYKVNPLCSEVHGFDLRLQTHGDRQFTVLLQENLEDVPTWEVNFDLLEEALLEYDRLSAGFNLAPNHAARVAALNAIFAKKAKKSQT